MDFEYIEKELLEMSAFLQLLSHIDNCEIDNINIITLAFMFAEKSEKLYCYILDLENI